MFTTRSIDSFSLFQSEKAQFREFLNKVKKSEYSRFDLSSIFLTEAGDVYARGCNQHGELGLGHKKPRGVLQGHFMPAKIDGLPPIKTFSIGYSSSFLIDHHDRIYAFGNNQYGQLGLGHNQDVFLPTCIECLDGVGIVKIECWTNTYFLCNTGAVYFSGQFNRQQQCVKTPQKITELPPICKIITSHKFDLFLSDQGEVFRRGNNTTTATIYSDTKMTKLPYKNVKDIECYDTPVVLTQEGTIYLGESEIPLDMPPVERMKYGHNHGIFNIFELKNGDIMVETVTCERIGIYNERYGIDNNIELPFKNKHYEAHSQIAQIGKKILDEYEKEKSPICINPKENHSSYSQDQLTCPLF